MSSVIIGGGVSSTLTHWEQCVYKYNLHIYISFRFVIKTGAHSPHWSPCRYDSTLRHAFRSPQLMENAAESGTKLPKHCSVDRGKSHYVGSGCHVKTINNHNSKLPAEMNHSTSNRSCLSPLNINLDPKQWPIQMWKKFDRRQWRAKSLQFKKRDILYCHLSGSCCWTQMFIQLSKKATKKGDQLPLNSLGGKNHMKPISTHLQMSLVFKDIQPHKQKIFDWFVHLVPSIPYIPIQDIKTFKRAPRESHNSENRGLLNLTWKHLPDLHSCKPSW